MWGLIKGIVNEIVDRSAFKSSVVFLGIESCGKTSLVEKLMCHVMPKRKHKTILPTMGLNTDTIEDGKIFLRIWDLGGRSMIRPVWDNYLSQADSLVYVVNGSQTEKIHETRKLFDDITCRFDLKIAVVFLNATESIFQVFPSALRFDNLFIDLEKPHDLELLYSWMKANAKKTET